MINFSDSAQPRIVPRPFSSCRVGSGHETKAPYHCIHGYKDRRIMPALGEGEGGSLGGLLDIRQGNSFINWNSSLWFTHTYLYYPKN